MIQRSEKKELLDITTPPLTELRQAMLHLQFMNRLFLNNWLVCLYVKKLIGGKPNVTILDIGTGIADLPLYLVSKLNKPSRSVTATGIDINAAVLALARENVGTVPGVSVLEQTLETTIDEQFTVGIMSQMLHHLSLDEAVEMLKTAHAKITTGIVISDFIRHPLNYWLAKWVIALICSNRFNNNDGPLSILRSYTDAEIKTILQNAGITKYKIHNFLIRKIVVIYK